MVELGYKLSSEEHAPNDLIANARRAEEAGFSFGMISDHYHPWVDKQGQSPFVWSVIGGISQATRRLAIVTGVTCPTVRIHPAIIAQAAATTRHAAARAVHARRRHRREPERAHPRHRLALGGSAARDAGGSDPGHPRRSGKATTPAIAAATTPSRTPGSTRCRSSSRRSSSRPAARRRPSWPARAGDGLVATAPNKELIKTFEQAGGKGKPRYAELTVCWAADEASAKKTAHEYWSLSALGGELSQELPLPRHFEQAAETVREEDVAKTVPCGPDPEKHRAALKKYVDAGFDHVAIHQVGPDQEGFFRFYENARSVARLSRRCERTPPVPRTGEVVRK